MKIDNYLLIRKNYANNFSKVSFAEAVHKRMENPEFNLMLIEELKIMMHLVEKNPDDMDLLVKMLKKFSEDNLNFNKDLAYGTIAMRAFHHLNEPEKALEVFRDPKANEVLFNRLMAYQLLLNLMYNNKKYSECREIYANVKDKLTKQDLGFPGTSIILLFAACYKEVTQDFDFEL